jgi:hypothetical protein
MARRTPAVAIDRGGVARELATIARIVQHSARVMLAPPLLQRRSIIVLRIAGDADDFLRQLDH